MKYEENRDPYGRNEHRLRAPVFVAINFRGFFFSKKSGGQFSKINDKIDTDRSKRLDEKSEESDNISVQ
jgi:hypothetical protein